MVSEPDMASSSNQNTQNANQPSQITFSFITPIKLDQLNYVICKPQVLSSIKGNRLEGYINRDLPAPKQYISRQEGDGSSRQIENPAYLNW